MHKSILPLVLANLALATAAFAGETDKKVVTPTEPEMAQPWRFSLALPAWIAWQVGDIGINGNSSHLKLTPRDTVPQVDMAIEVRAEARKGRFGIMGDYLFMSVSDGIGNSNAIISKVDVQTDQHIAELALSWRLLESDRGYLDAFAGVRYTNLYQNIGLHVSEGEINERSDQFVDNLVDRAVTTIRERIEPAIREHLSRELEALRNRDPVLPQGPIGDAIRARVEARIRSLLAARRAELDGAIASGVRARIDAAKDRLSHEIARTLKDELRRSVSRTDDWWDPFVGLKARYYLSKPVYLTARADIGGFGVGADLSWQVNAGIGFHLTRSIFSEITYRAYDVDYNHGGLDYDVFTHGVEVTTGITF